MSGVYIYPVDGMCQLPWPRAVARICSGANDLLRVLDIVQSVLRRFAGVKRCSSPGQFEPKPFCDRVRAAKRAPRATRRVLERRHGLGAFDACSMAW